METPPARPFVDSRNSQVRRLDARASVTDAIFVSRVFGRGFRFRELAALAFGESDQIVKFLAGGAGIDRFGSYVNAFDEFLRASAHHEGRRGVHQYDIAMRSVVVRASRRAQHVADDFRVRSRISTGDRFERSASNPKIFGRYAEGSHHTVAQLSHRRLAGNRDFIQSLCAVYNVSAGETQLSKDLRDQLGQVRSVNSDHLRRGVGWICQRAEEVENRAHPQFAACRNCMTRGSM